VHGDRASHGRELPDDHGVGFRDRATVDDLNVRKSQLHPKTLPESPSQSNSQIIAVASPAMIELVHFLH